MANRPCDYIINPIHIYIFVIYLIIDKVYMLNCILMNFRLHLIFRELDRLIKYSKL